MSSPTEIVIRRRSPPGAQRVRPWPHALRRARRRPRRQHPARPARAGRRRDRRAGAGEGRVLQPRRQREGPHRAAHDRGRGGVRGAEAGRHDRRADVRQHRCRPGDGRPAQGLQVRVRLPGQGERGQAQRAARVRRRGRGVPDGGRARTTPTPTTSVSDRLVTEIDGAWKPNQYANQREPAVALPRHRPRAVGADRAGGSRTSWPASAPAARSAAPAATSRRCPTGGCR